MKTPEINRAYLENLTTADLIELAENYGLDVSESIPRQIIIGEILSVVQEDAGNDEVPVYEPSDTFSFNRDTVSFLLRNPGWGYVSWSIRESVRQQCIALNGFSRFFLRVHSVAGSKDGGNASFYDIAVGVDDKCWFVYLDSGMFSYRVEFCCLVGKKVSVIASSREVRLPLWQPTVFGNDAVSDQAPLLRLSGIEDLYKLQFKHHRQTFQ